MRDTPPGSLSFPPLLWGAPAKSDALGHAVQHARQGCDAGLVTYVLGPLHSEAALVFAPEVPLAQAMAMLPLCGIGFQNALGALAPPEVAVHLDWDGGLRLNGGTCGKLRARASTRDPEAVPDWLVIGWTVAMLAPEHDTGHRPDETALHAEGCGDVEPGRLVESWARHCLHWINRWEDEGPRSLHAEWRGLIHGLNTDMTHGARTGTFLGVDADFGMLLKDAQTTHLIPLTDLLTETPA